MDLRVLLIRLFLYMLERRSWLLNVIERAGFILANGRKYGELGLSRRAFPAFVQLSDDSPLLFDMFQFS